MVCLKELGRCGAKPELRAKPLGLVLAGRDGIRYHSALGEIAHSKRPLPKVAAGS